MAGNVMRIVSGNPPMFDQIASVFPAARKQGVIFTWGNTIYNPTGAKITKPLLVHEGLHAEQQGDNPHAWWARYLVDPAFRLSQELPAHALEYYAFCRRHGDPGRRVRVLSIIAGRLSGELYGGLMTLGQARDAVLTGAGVSA